MSPNHACSLLSGEGIKKFQAVVLSLAVDETTKALHLRRRGFLCCVMRNCCVCLLSVQSSDPSHRLQAILDDKILVEDNTAKVVKSLQDHGLVLAWRGVN